MLSVVIPVYRAQEVVDELVARLTKSLSALQRPYEIVLVEDSSPDRSWEKIEAVCRREPCVRALSLSRNFGQHAAITAGLSRARGDLVIVMDCDLQDDPADIPKLIAEHEKGFDIVYTVKSARRHSFGKNLIASLYHWIFNRLVGNDDFNSDTQIGSYSLISRKVVTAFLQLNDAHRHYLSILRWLGFRSSSVPIEHHERFAGRSSYTFRKLVVHALDGIVSQSNRLLHASVILGFIFVAVSVLATLWIVAMYLLHGFREGWASVVILILLCTGIILLMIGIHGLYLGRIFDQVRGRPLFVIRESLNFAAD